jgi:phosphoribosylanthranilate isomerase
MTKIKICGITNPKDAVLSMELGADALGFNFYKESPRYIAPQQVREITDGIGDGILTVGVFVNKPIDEVVDIVSKTGIKAVQLHGDEQAEYVAQLASRTNGKIIKALRVTPNFRPLDAAQFDADAILLDGYSEKERGGTGKSFDWQVAKQVREHVSELYLAGGLSPENVGTAILEVRPFAVDVCSSIESRPGVKDPEKLRSFIENCRRVI